MHSSLHISDTHALLQDLASYFSKWSGTFYLHSGKKSASHFLALFPAKTLTLVSENSLNVETSRGIKSYDKEKGGWELLEEALGSFSGSEKTPKWMGFFSYELAGISDSRKTLSLPSSSFPLAYFQRSCLLLSFYSCKLSLSILDEEPICEEAKPFIQKIRNHDFSFITQREEKNSKVQVIKWGEKKETYLEKVSEIKKRIRNGGFYQVNLSHEFLFQGEIDPYFVFSKLSKINPAPFSAFISLPTFVIVCSSPERLLLKQNDQLESRPIKGTMPRSKDLKKDRENLKELLDSEKERAELLMITDLLRNDLNRVSIPGSVTVDKLFHLESYTNVHHMLSFIRSKARANIHPLQLFRHCFPGGSITGCPKLKAMETILEMEQRPRKIYTGSLGYFSENGDFDFNICIRTLLFEGKQIGVSLGGAIVYDSIPEKEYEETLHKGASIFEALGINQHFSQTSG